METLEERYRTEGKKMGSPVIFEGVKKVSARSFSNIALIKYWGKHDFQLPNNPSLSMTLSNSFTGTEILFSLNGNSKPSFRFWFEGKENKNFASRVEKYLKILTEYFPFLNSLHLEIESSNSFPHSSGIASSASSMSALAMCVCLMEQELYGIKKEREDFLRKVSFMARLGSGSASRSVWPEYVTWGKSKYYHSLQDEVAQPFPFEVHGNFKSMGDAILITSSKKKKVSSSAGHNLMEEHPFAKARYEQADYHFFLLMNALKTGNIDDFIMVVEKEALTLHSLMLSSNPGFTLLNDNSWRIIDEIRDFRLRTGKFITFTLDAGPNVHLLYNLNDRDEILNFINQKLMGFCDNGKWIDDKILHKRD